MSDSAEISKQSFATLFPKKRKRTEVETVVASTGFPISSPQRPRDKKTHSEPSSVTAVATAQSEKKTKKSSKLLDWHETAKEIRHLGASAFVKKQKRNYEDEEYKRLTGRERKKQKVPFPIAQAINKAARKREAKAREEARAAGMVIPKQEKTKRKDKDPSRAHGPAPSIGFVKKGVLQLKKKPV